MTCAKQDRCEHGKCCQKHIGDIITTCYFFEQKEPLNNFERITESKEVLAEFIVNAMQIYDEDDDIALVDALKMALKDIGEDYFESLREDTVEWLKQESEE